MNILQTFGVNWILLVASIVNFLVVLYVLKRYLYKPLFSVIEKRQKEIAAGLSKADESQKTLVKAQEEEKQILRKAQDTAKMIIQDAKDQAATQLKDNEEKIKQQTERMLTDARLQIDRETKEAEMKLTQHVTELSLDMLKKSLTDIFSTSEQEQILDRAVKTLKNRPN